MNNIENFDSRLELFLKNKMSVEDSLAFLGELKDNPELRERAQAMAVAIKNMKELRHEYGQRVVSKIENVSELKFREELGLPQKTRIIPFNSFVKMSIAVCFVGGVMFGGYRYHLYNQTVTLGNNYYAEVSTALVIRDADENASQLTILFCNVKDNANLDNTIKELSKMFNLAISDEFNDYTNYINDIGWNLAIAYLKNGDRQGAIEVLEILISQTESDIFKEKCQQLIADIKDL